ncbi:DHS-like NAD/FAD-binding domain-containing protein [Dipodascopsis tothii]|uniref:DHS-like NAD/FAD-binding domain-containing protein n=1 Tax=Dipodascopsis tothii TaxID=44089 RepID=UPI0034CFF17E
MDDTTAGEPAGAAPAVAAPGPVPAAPASPAAAGPGATDTAATADAPDAPDAPGAHADAADADSDGESWESHDGVRVGSESESDDDDPLVNDELAYELCAFLRRHGQKRFVEKYVVESHMSLREVLYALGFKIRDSDEIDDMQLAQLLPMAMERQLSWRERLADVSTLEAAAERINRAQNIIVLTGAGISTSLGIPDFRSGTGLYEKVRSMGLSQPEEVFDLYVFRDDPSIFYRFSKEILPTVKRFTPTHAFIRLLQDKGKLLTNYTQNIDNLESFAGIDAEKLVQCHGSFASASCLSCGAKVPGEDLFPDIREGRVARCRQPAEESRKRKRDADSDDDEPGPSADGLCGGVMKPDITFFGEALPKTFENRLLHHDLERCDLLICIGTSLEVAPVSETIKVLAHTIPQIYISRTPCRHWEFDVNLLGDCDDVVEFLCCKSAGRAEGFLGPDWPLEHEMIPPGGFQGSVVDKGDGYYKFLKPGETEPEPESDSSSDEASERDPASRDDTAGIGGELSDSAEVEMVAEFDEELTINTSGAPSAAASAPASPPA